SELSDFVAVTAIIRPVSGRRSSGIPWLVISISLLLLMMMLAYALLDDRSAAVWLDFWGVVPEELFPEQGGLRYSPSGIAGLFSALFVHASWLHLIGNLAYLWVFGISVERQLGHWNFLFAYVLIGGLANAFMALQNAGLDQPIIGASGAISAIIGIYLGSFPNGRIGLWIPLGLYLHFARIPALLVIGSWFTLQLMYTVFGPDSNSVAWWAHISGFVAGLVSTLLFRLVLGGSRVNRRSSF
ncbi:MAG: rhomboid family intramembrane serine protease, partial [Pseudomonadota bacterium]